MWSARVARSPLAMSPEGKDCPQTLPERKAQCRLSQVYPPQPAQEEGGCNGE